MTTNEIETQVTQLFSAALATGQWMPLTQLRERIPDELAEARCRSVSPIVLADLSDPKEFGRHKLAAEAVKALEATGKYETRGPAGQQEMRLVQGTAGGPAKAMLPATPGDGSMVQPAGRVAKKKEEPRPPAVTPSTPPASAQTPTTDKCSAQTQGSGEAASATSRDPEVKPSSDLPFHPITDLFPPMTEAQYVTLKEDVRQNGQRVDAWTFKGEIIDGKHRHLVNRELGRETRFQEWDGKGSLVAFVIGLNQHRRHLTPSQLAMVAAKAKGMFEEEARQRMLAGRAAANPPLGPEEGRTGEAAAQAAAVFHVGTDSVYKAQKILQHGVPELQKAVESGQVTVTAAAEVAELPEEEQAAAVAAGAKEVVAKAKKIRSTPQGDRTEGIVLRDIEAVKDLVERVGATSLKKLIDVMAR